MAEMLAGGELDVLTGDYLAELTMLILGRDRLKDPTTGYAKTFLRHLEDSLGTALEKGVRIVSNAGGLNPAGLANAVRVLADSLGLDVLVAHVEGDDLQPRADELALGDTLAANAYLGAWGIAECLDAGAQVVVTGRVTDASLVVGPAASHFGWGRTDWDRLAGAVVAGHVLECGAQATGGNYAFFTELGLGDRPLGFPLAEVHADGSSVITKHAGTGGAVTTGTVTAQLLYEIGGPRYLGPDVTARFDTIALSDDGPDRVRISGVRGEPPPSTLKVGCNALGGFRNEVTFVLTGLDVEAKAALVQEQLSARFAGLEPRWTLARTDHADADVQEEAAALLHCVVRGPDAKRVGRAFTGAAIELALASYPGFHVTAPPGDASPYGVFTAAFVDAGQVLHVAVLPDGTRVDIAPTTATDDDPAPIDLYLPTPRANTRTVPAPLGRIVGARSGDKGGHANIGLWTRTDDAFSWFVHQFDIRRLQELLPETAPLLVVRHVLPNLRAVNLVIEDVLGEGVAYNARHDPQAKALGEWLRSRTVLVPEDLL
ncbi:acyclic terpene utilization AtuA family protein [uncultured Jatrophihabitans sp.]|uniref:acyclic terpene utilization AtuA family protein n=1 Tax=uncultured Jatrophihabitans sp. TaxID=1610747 RepID=UPI0035CC5E41